MALEYGRDRNTALSVLSELPERRHEAVYPMDARREGHTHSKRAI